MPLSHRNLAGWYLQLAQHLEAGLPLANALRSCGGIGLPAANLEVTARLIESGGSVDDALRSLQPGLPPTDLPFLSAAAATGRMPQILRALSTRHAHYSSVKSRLVLACLYPLAVLHTGILLFPFLRMIDWEKGFQWDPAAYARTLALLLLPLWSIVLAVFILSRRQSPWLGRLGQVMPVLRRYRQTQALADFSFALGNFLDAGLPIGRAWSAAGAVARVPELAAAARIINAKIEEGEAPGPQLRDHRCFPEDFIALYRTGESTGQLEYNLLHLASLNQERANHQLKLATLLYPTLLLVVVVGVVAYQIISFYAGYYKMLSDMV